MVEKIGKVTYKVLIISLWSVFISADPSVSLRITDMRGKGLEQAQVGVPFSITVTVSGDTQNLPAPFIEGLDSFELKGTSNGTSSMSINGKTTVTKTVRISAVAHDEGTYTIGPVKITFKGNIFSSDPLSLIVGKQQTLTQNEQEQQALIVIAFDKKTVYQGEPVQFSLRFYYADDSLRLDGIKEPEFKNFSATKLEGPRSGTGDINNKKYRYLEWTTTAYPEKSGVLKVSSLEGVYTEPTQAGIFGGMASFFGGMREQHSLYSNSIEIDVKPLPVHDSAIKAVGNFSRAVLRLTNKKAQEGEAVVAFFEVFGTGNIVQLTHPSLVLPEGLSVYESNTEITKSGAEYKKSWEYVVQGRAVGTYTIASQEFVYFDLHDERYKTLITDPIELVIEQSSEVKKISDDQYTDIQKTDLVSTFSIIKSGSWKKVSIKIIPWWLFFILIIFMIGVIATYHGYKRYKVYQLARAPFIRYKQAFNNARKSFENSRRHGYVGHVYHVFIELFAARLYKDRTEITEEFMEDFLLQKGISEVDMVQWRLLLAHLAQYAFAFHGMEDEHKNKIFNQSAYWLNKMEALL